MASFVVIAQHYLKASKRITRTVQAVDEVAVLRMVSPNLEAFGFYVTSIKKA